MTILTSFRATLACPSCSVPAPRTIAVSRTAEDGAEAWHARVHECVACWQRRARALNTARARLRAAGELGETASGQPTWLGATISPDSDDPVTGAMLSELLRGGVEKFPASMRLTAHSLGLRPGAEVLRR